MAGDVALEMMAGAQAIPVQTVHAGERDPAMGYALMKQLLELVTEGLDAARMQFVDIYGKPESARDVSNDRAHLHPRFRCPDRGARCCGLPKGKPRWVGHPPSREVELAIGVAAERIAKDVTLL